MSKFTLLCAIIAIFLAIFSVNAGKLAEQSYKLAVGPNETSVSLNDDEIPVLNPDGSVTPHLSVNGKSFAYYKFAITTANPTRHSVVKMIREDNESDPDLYIKIGAIPDRVTRDYDDVDLGTYNEHRVQVFHAAQDSFIYIGVYNYKDNVSLFSLQVNTYGCRNFGCGGDSKGTCLSGTGECQCKEGTLGSFCEHNFVNAKYDDTYRFPVDSGRITYLKFSGAEIVNGAYLFASLKREELKGDFTLMLGNQNIPTTAKNVAVRSIDSFTSDLALDLTPETIGTGDWIYSVEITSRVPYPIEVDFTAHMELCLNGCSGHGACNAEVSKCACEPGFTGTEDCSLFSDPLKHGAKTSLHLGPFSYLTYEIDVEAKYTTGHPIELTVTFETSTPDVVPPVLYIRKDQRPQTVGQSIYDSISALPAPATQTVHIPSHDLKEGKYFVTIDNYEGNVVEGSISYHLIPHCTNDCSGHGSCNALGVCQCVKGFYGGDCSVALPKCYVPEPEKTKSSGFSLGMTFGIAALFAFLGVGIGALLHKFVLAKYYVRATAEAPSNLAYAQMN